ncbi:MAG: peptide chain release factor 3 [bacterium]
MNPTDEIARRRTFAIIAHPDAGKTTLTEKFLLYGGAIQMAGSVKARRAQRSATSDWMAIERERGISVTSTVLQFEYEGFKVNLLDTPGHQDFGEDTYRTLLAADAAIMLLDGGKGVEPVTEKLYAVCKLKGLPVFTFVNKMDRPALSPLAILDELQAKLGLDAYPVNWPIGSGPSFCGVADPDTRSALLFERQEGGAREALARVATLDDPAITEKLGEESLRDLRSELDMLAASGLRHDEELVQAGLLSPVFFGSAVTNFGVEPLLKGFLALGPAPLGRSLKGGGLLEPRDARFSAFVFKSQANMDPRHRDRIAFLRVVSGRFEGGMPAWNARLGREVRLNNPKEFFGRERDTVTEAFPGDILGIMNNGQLRLGDTLSDAHDLRFPGVPRFPYEHFGVLRCAPGARKAFVKGMEELLEEGAIQAFRDPRASGNDLLLGAVGPLQFEVLRYRLLNEYGAKTDLEKLDYRVARWLQAEPKAVEALRTAGTCRLVEDRDGHAVALFRDTWSLEHAQRNHSSVGFLTVAPVE